MKRYLICALVAVALAGPASAVTLQFGCIAGTAVACSVGEASLSVDVVANTGNTVTLTFSNGDPGTSSLVGVYIEDAGLLSRISIAGGAGTDFKKNGKPKNPPGGSAVSFVSDFRANARKPADTNGVNGGETLTIVLSVKDRSTSAEVLAAILDGSLRIGTGINDADPNCVGQNTGPQCVGDPGVASFVNLLVPVPEPGAALLGGVACLGLLFYGRRR
jgi:hypothetical protein